MLLSIIAQALYGNVCNVPKILSSDLRNSPSCVKCLFVDVSVISYILHLIFTHVQYFHLCAVRYCPLLGRLLTLFNRQKLATRKFIVGCKGPIYTLTYYDMQTESNNGPLVFKMTFNEWLLSDCVFLHLKFSQG